MRRFCSLFRPVQLQCRSYQRTAGIGFDADELGSSLTKPDYNGARPIVKNVYEESEVTKNRPESEIQEYFGKHNITVTGKDVPKPVLTIEECEGTSKIRGLMEKKSFTEPTPIQAMCWPLAMSGKDMIGVAQTGSGKTMGYLLPAALHCRAQPKMERGHGPITVVLAPTRELVQQICTVSHQWLNQTFGIHVTGVFGGVSKLPQLQSLDRGSHLCVATPGRLLDILETQGTSLLNSSYLVLDEADRMLDMGFEPQIRKIINQIRSDRQTMMFSATWPKEVQSLAMEFMDLDAARINIGSMELCANGDIEQEIQMVDSSMNKRELLLEVIRQNPGDKTLIFAATKRRVSTIVDILRQERIRCVETHGDLSQARRDQSLHMFRGSTNVMVATDVAARGLDVSDIRCVVNYDFPQSTEDYVHRIGRTGRSGNTGKAISFFSPEDARHADGLIKILRQANQDVPEELEEFAATTPGSRNERYSSGGRSNNRGGYGGSNYRKSGYGGSGNGRSNYGRSSYDRSDNDRSNYDRPSYGRSRNKNFDNDPYDKEYGRNMG